MDKTNNLHEEGLLYNLVNLKNILCGADINLDEVREYICDIITDNFDKDDIDQIEEDIYD